MFAEGGQNKIRNQLWRARKRRGLAQKQVAYLLGHKSADLISRYEKGLKTPSLKTALMLEAIFGVPVRMLFRELFEDLNDEVQQKINSSPLLSAIYSDLFSASDSTGGFCSYEELLKAQPISPSDLITVRRHATMLVKKMAYL